MTDLTPTRGDDTSAFAARLNDYRNINAVACSFNLDSATLLWCPHRIGVSGNIRDFTSNPVVSPITRELALSWLPRSCSMSTAFIGSIAVKNVLITLRVQQTWLVFTVCSNYSRCSRAKRT